MVAWCACSDPSDRPVCGFNSSGVACVFPEVSQKLSSDAQKELRKMEPPAGEKDPTTLAAAYKAMEMYMIDHPLSCFPHTAT